MVTAVMDGSRIWHNTMLLLVLIPPFPRLMLVVRIPPPAVVAFTRYVIPVEFTVYVHNCDRATCTLQKDTQQPLNPSTVCVCGAAWGAHREMAPDSRDVMGGQAGLRCA